MKGLISSLTPLNLHEEKIKFFADFSYQPQFVYSREFSADELTKWGVPSAKYFEATKTLLIQHPFPKSHDEPLAITSETDVTDRLTKLLRDLNITHPLGIFFSKNLISRCSINQERIVFRQPVEFSLEDFNGLMNHEIQSHLLRMINNNQQVWSVREKTPKEKFLRAVTEEGVANLHTFVEQSQKFMRRSWLNYCAIFLAQKHSFSQVFNQLRELGADVNQAWFATIRTKRGLIDTSQPGGNTKGLVYLHGSVKIWKWLTNGDNDPHQLYLGRVSVEELADRQAEAKTDGLTYPTFFAKMDHYRQAIREIGTCNLFDELL